MRRLTLKRILRWLLGMQEKYTLAENVHFSITAVIPAYNEEKNIADTIRSIRNQTYPVDRILVVDDCSSDRTAEIARNAGAEVVRTPKNSGTKAQAQNYTLPFIDTDVVVTIDGDTMLARDAIEKILPALDDDTASACGFVIPQKIETLWEKARFVQYLYFITLNKGAQNHWGVPMVSSGCFSAFRTKLLKNFGGFPRSTMAEDMTLTWKFLIAGKKIKLVPTAICFPMDPHNYHSYRAQVERWYRSFFQNVGLYRWRLLKNFRLFLFVIWYLVSGLTFFLGMIALTLFLMKTTFGFWAFIWLAMEFLLVITIALFKGWKLGKFSLVLKSIPNYWIVSPVDNYLFLKSFWKEWVVQDRLMVWEKGH